MEVVQFVTESLGDSSYLVVSEGVAAVIDPQRDVRAYIASAAERGAAIRYVFETHVHNDYLSGGRELAALGAEIVAPAGSHLEFPHTEIHDGEECVLGAVRLRAVATPGHTYEHHAYLLLDASGRAAAAFTGGVILVAAAGRTDLLGPDHTEALTRLQWESGQRIAHLLPPTGDVFPTHGAGSFCSSASAGGERRSTLGLELAQNPLFANASYEMFRAVQLGSPAPVPGYYRHMSPINRRGPGVFGTPPVPSLLAPAAIASMVHESVPVLDVRRRADHAAAHFPGTWGIAEGGSFLAYVGWLVPFDAPLALVSYDDVQAARVTTDLFRIGYEHVQGFHPFDDALRALASPSQVPLMTPSEGAAVLAAGVIPVIDVRFRYEQETMLLPGAHQLPIDSFAEWAPSFRAARVVVSCASGERAVMAASLLRAHGVDATAVDQGGAEEVRAHLSR